KENSSSYPEININNENDMFNLLQKARGYFSIVHISNNTLFAAVDHIRSYPLFYGYKKSTFFISDNAEWVREHLGDKDKDELAKTEFKLAGYVTGPDTLYPNVKQLQAGEMLTLN